MERKTVNLQSRLMRSQSEAIVRGIIEKRKEVVVKDRKKIQVNHLRGRQKQQVSEQQVCHHHQVFQGEESEFHQGAVHQKERSDGKPEEKRPRWTRRKMKEKRRRFKRERERDQDR